MKLILSVLLCGLFTLLLPITSTASNTSLVFIPSELDVGEVKPLEIISRSVKIVNPSKESIRIIRTRACCGAKVTLSSSNIPPSGSVDMNVIFTSGVSPETFRKSITVIADKTQPPLVSYNITGSVKKSQLENTGSTVIIESGDAAVCNEPTQKNSSEFKHISIAIPSVMLAGLIDGFNPCAFSIVIILAGILAVGGRKRKAQILGGVAFCFSSFATYMLMGFGLLEVIRKLSGLQLCHEVVLWGISVLLFVVSFLSFRDAFRYRAAGVPSVITLQLPDSVKKAIKFVAEKSWSGPTVALTGLICGFLVTLLDSLCTGQVYVPILVLLSRQDDSVYSLFLLALYNLTFITPLVAVFIFSAFGVGSDRMRMWSKRNVFPSKIALGFLFAVLGVLVLLGVEKNDFLDVGLRAEKTEVSHRLKNSDSSIINKPSSQNTNKESADKKNFSKAELANGNEMLHTILNAKKIDLAYPQTLVEILSDKSIDEQWRNHALQFVPECMMRLEKDSPERSLLAMLLQESLRQSSSVLAGTALLGYVRLSEETGFPERFEVSGWAVSLASDASSRTENLVTALRVGAELGDKGILVPAKYWARYGKSEFLRCVAISVVRDIGKSDEGEFLRSLIPARTKSEESVIMRALKSTEERK